MSNNFNDIKLEAIVSVRGKEYVFGCNEPDVKHVIPNAKGKVKVGEVTAEKVQEKITAIVGSVCDLKRASYLACKGQYSGTASKSLREIDYYTQRLESILKYPLCKHYVETELYSGGVLQANCDLGVLTINNPNLIALSVEDNRLNASFILKQLLSQVGYPCEDGITKVINAIKNANFCNNALADYLDESEKELYNVLLLVFKDKLDGAENELKELFHILTCSFASNIILGVKKHICDVFELGQVTVRDVRNGKNKVNYYIPKGEEVVPPCTEVNLIMRLSVGNLPEWVNLKGFKEATKGVMKVEIPMYIPVSMSKAMSI